MRDKPVINSLLFAFYTAAAAFILGVCAVMFYLLATGRRDFDPVVDTLCFAVFGPLGLYMVRLAVSCCEGSDE